MKEQHPFGQTPSMEQVAAIRFARYLAKQQIVPDLMRAADGLEIDHPILGLVTAAWAVVVERIIR